MLHGGARWGKKELVEMLLVNLEAKGSGGLQHSTVPRERGGSKLLSPPLHLPNTFHLELFVEDMDFSSISSV